MLANDDLIPHGLMLYTNDPAPIAPDPNNKGSIQSWLAGIVGKTVDQTWTIDDTHKFLDKIFETYPLKGTIFEDLARKSLESAWVSGWEGKKISDIDVGVDFIRTITTAAGGGIIDPNQQRAIDQTVGQVNFFLAHWTDFLLLLLGLGLTVYGGTSLLAKMT